MNVLNHDDKKIFVLFPFTWQTSGPNATTLKIPQLWQRRRSQGSLTLCLTPSHATSMTESWAGTVPGAGLGSDLSKSTTIRVTPLREAVSSMIQIRSPRLAQVCMYDMQGSG